MAIFDNHAKKYLNLINFINDLPENLKHRQSKPIKKF